MCASVQRELFPRATEAVQISAQRVGGGYWRLRVATRHHGIGWEAARVDTYEPLSSDELETAAATALAVALEPLATD